MTPPRAHVVVADPPWSLGDALPGPTRGAARNYRCLTLAEICRFPLPPMERDSWLFLWRLASMQEEALQVVRSWGFVPKAELVWEKLTVHGKPWMGMGHYTRGAHETAILAVRGHPKPADRSIRSRFAAKVPVDDDGLAIHSAKPEEFYALVERLTGRGPWVELFARRRRAKWISVGDELPEEAA